MADVDLSVAVTATGIRNAINEINALKEAAKATDTQLLAMASSSRAAFATLASGKRTASEAEAAVKSLSASFRNQTLDATKATDSLKSLNTAYASLGKKSGSVTLSASARIAQFGGGDLALGIEKAKYAAQLRDAMKPNMERDLNIVLAEQNALLRARGELLASQKNISQATWQASLASMTPLQRATEQLTRAEKELASARNRVEETKRGVFRGSGNQFVTLETETQKLNAQVAANNALAEAIGKRSRAQEQATREQERAAAAANAAGDRTIGAYQGLIAYSVIASGANRIRDSILEIGGASVTASRELERSFANVDRTFDGTSVQLDHLKNRLFELSTTTPVSFTDLSQIAALGNQLNIQAEDIEGFTKTIAQYTAISGESADTASVAFGRIANLTGLSASQFNNLGSAITYVARTSVATESTIQNTAKEISALAAGSGFSAQAIVGLSGALSSLAIPPERARGALSLYFGALNSAVAEGGPKLAAFAQLTNMSADQLERMVRENKGQEVFTAFIKGLSQLDTVAKTTALDTLGLSTIRVDQTMRALAQNIPLVTNAFAGADAAFQQNTELARQYGIIQDTLDSKIIEFQNAIQNAASAVGDLLKPVLETLIVQVTDLLVGFAEFADRPWGQFVIGLALTVGVLVLAITGLIGALALAKVALTVIPWAMSGLQVNGATAAIFQYIAGLFRLNIVSTEAAAGQYTLSVATRGAAVSATAAAAGFRTMKWALAGTGIGLAVVLVGSLAEALLNTSEAAKLTTSDVTGLQDAIRTDTQTWKDTGNAITTYRVAASGSADEQRKAADASRNWATVLGTDLVNGADAAREAIQNIAAGDAVTDVFRSAIGSNEEVRKIIEDSQFAEAWGSVGLNINDLIAAGLRDNGSGDAVRAAIEEKLGKVRAEVIGGGYGNYGGQVRYLDEAGNDVTYFYNKLQKLIPLIASEGDVMRDFANGEFVMNGAMSAAVSSADSLSDGIIGASDSLSKFQDNLGSGVGKFVEFSDILTNIKKELNIDNGTTLVDASRFSSDLAKASDSAVSFYDGVTRLAVNGRTSFATELAALGPEAQGLLASALDLSPEAQAELEANSRFAAFLASDEFKRSFKENMRQSNQAYATIFEATGDLGQVKGYIAAQVAGTGAEWERQWDINHPTATLNVEPELSFPTSDEIALWEDQLSGKITIKTRWEPGTGVQKVVTDNKTGNSLVVPASLDTGALSAIISAWNEDQNQKPAELAAKINTEGFNSDIDLWKAEHGAIPIPVRLVPVNPEIIGETKDFVSIKKRHAKGGEVTEYPYASAMPRFASGGGFRVTGGGSGTDDRYLAAVSAGEYWNTKDSVNFWGVDVFDSLNRKMFPSSFLGLLSRAMVSGNSGPSHVAYVNVAQNNPLTRDPLKQLRESSEALAAGIWEG